MNSNSSHGGGSKVFSGMTTHLTTGMPELRKTMTLKSF